MTGVAVSVAWRSDMAKIAPDLYQDPAATNRKLKLFYTSCGMEDPRMQFQKKALEDFRSHKINLTLASFPGAHEWKVSRHSLADLAPKLFRQENPCSHSSFSRQGPLPRRSRNLPAANPILPAT
jgi:hypothetical protein